MNSRCLFRPGFLAALTLAVALPARTAEPTVALKDVFKEHFPMGTAVNRSMMTGGAGFRRNAEQNAADVALLKAHFNQITAENDMKWQLIHPREGADGYFGPRRRTGSSKASSCTKANPTTTTSSGRIR